jgi:hypothetical protein
VHRTFLLFILILFSITAQQSSSQQQPPIPPLSPGPTQPKGDNDPYPTQIQKDMEKKANQQRQKELKRDTEKLLKLSTELKDYVDKTNENVLSLEVLKKAEEIEKLAHSVRTKMRGYN